MNFFSHPQSSQALPSATLKVLMIAYECSPFRGSEWAVGWGRLLGASRVATVHCIVAEHNRADLDRARAGGLLPANVFLHTPVVDAILQRKQRGKGAFDYNYAAYRHWHRLAFALALDLHRQHGFDVAHQTTVCTFREPGYLWQLGIPFVWGPFGGTQNFPFRMLPLLAPQFAGKELARTVANRVVLRTSPAVRRAMRQTSVVFAANSTAERDLRSVFPGARVERLLETGLNDFDEPCRIRWTERVRDLESGLPQRPLRLLWSGQLQPRKGLPVLLRALALLRNTVPIELEVLGDGPMRNAWRREADQIAPQIQVRFHGRLSYEEAVQRMGAADLFCFTSLRDTSGNVVLEALAAGVPVLCFDHQGARDMVDDRCGIRIPVSTPEQAVNAWASAICKLWLNPRRLLALSRSATGKAREFLWSRNSERVNEVYRSLAAASQIRSSVTAASEQFSASAAMLVEVPA